MSNNNYTLNCVIINNDYKTFIQRFVNDFPIITEENALLAITEGSFEILVFMINNGLIITERMIKHAIRKRRYDLFAVLIGFDAVPISAGMLNLANAPFVTDKRFAELLNKCRKN